MTIAAMNPASSKTNDEINEKINAKTEIPEQIWPIELNEDLVDAIIIKFPTIYL